MTTNTDGTAVATDPAAADAAAAGSLLAPAAGEAAAQPGPNDWIPEKYQVKNEAGEFDEAASSRKLADAYRSLESKLGKGATLAPPATPDDYVIEPPKDADGKPIEGVVEAFVKDPLFQGIAKKAHAAGIPNEHMQFFVQEYMQFAPELFAADKSLTTEEASAELSKVWTDKATFDDRVGKAVQTVREFTKDVPEDQPGSNARVLAKFQNDPDFVAFVARIGGEVKFGEDTLPNNAAATSDADVESLQKSEAYWKQTHPDHTKVKQQVEAYYARKFGTELHR